MWSVCNGYKCILLYMKFIWCSCGWGLSALVLWSSIDLWLIGGGGGVCLHWYLCILLYVKLSQCSGLP